MTVQLTDIISTTPQAAAASSGTPNVLDQQVPVSQLAAALGATGGGPAKFAAVSTNTPATLTGAQMAGADVVVVQMTAALAGAGTLNTDTAANIYAAIPNPIIGASYILRIINSSSGNFAWTLTGGTGVTITGTATIAQNTTRDFVVTITSATAVAIRTIGTGTFS